MSAIAGLVNLDGSPVMEDALDRMMAKLAHRAPCGSRTWCDGAVGLGQGGPARIGDSIPVAGLAANRASGVVAVADARIDNRIDLAGMLGLSGTMVPDDVALILLAYQRWGSECPSRLIGDFAFVVWDPRCRVVFCARDPMGVRPLYFHRSRGRFAFASEIKALFELPGIPREIDERQIALYLTGTFEDRAATVYAGIERLPAAHGLVVTSLRATSKAYWNPEQVGETRLANDGEYVEAFREIFTEAVRARLRGPGVVGATLSGGLDSSSIVCTARRIGAGQRSLPTFSLVFPSLPEDERRLIDERQFMNDVVRGGGVEPYQVRADLLSPFSDIERVLWHVDEPHPAPNLYLHWGLYGAAREHGVSILLDGFDGDSAVSHGLGRLNGLARLACWPEFETEVRSFARRREIAPRSVLRHFGLPYLAGLAREGDWRGWYSAATEMRRRFDLSGRRLLLRHGLAPAAPAWMRSAWHAVRRQRSGPRSILHSALARQIAAAASPDSTRAAGTPTEREMHVEGISQPLYQLTLEIADKSARAFGIEPRYPFFDRRLIEFCISLPDEQKFAAGWPRYLFRRAMEGVLPPEIQWRTTKGNLSPNFDRTLRTRGASTLDRVSAEGGTIDRYVDQSALRTVTKRYLDAPPGRWGDTDGLLLFRVGVLAKWLDVASGSKHDPAVAAKPSVPDGVPMEGDQSILAHMIAGRKREPRAGGPSGRVPSERLAAAAFTRPHNGAAAPHPHHEDRA